MKTATLLLPLLLPCFATDAATPAPANPPAATRLAGDRSAPAASSPRAADASAQTAAEGEQAPSADDLQPLTTHTVTAPPGHPTLRATLNDLPWLDGHWRGTPDARGTWGEEIWLPAAAGARAAVFRMLRGEQVWFYELVLLREVDGGLVLELKHFHADLTGWEERTEVRRFPLLALTENEARFDGMTYRREDARTLVAWVAVSSGDGRVEELELRYQRVD
jgi:hypothetical protein